MDERIEVPINDVGLPPNYEMKMRSYRAYQLVFFVLGFVEVLLAVRFILKLFGANPANIFARIIYFLSGILMLPFSGLFGGSSDVQLFESSTVMAMVIYSLVFWGIAKLILIFKSRPSVK